MLPRHQHSQTPSLSFEMADASPVHNHHPNNTNTLLGSVDVVEEVSGAVTAAAVEDTMPAYERHHVSPSISTLAATIPWAATSTAASVESFYRAALNAMINRRILAGNHALFPNMHIQVPTRVLYVNGFKAVRMVVDSHVDEKAYQNQTLVKLGKAFAPGVVMTPVSSILEACHVETSQPLYRRWINGVGARGVREVIFGVGLNQASDALTDMMPQPWHPALRTAAGSVVAGVLAGYLSHVPHVLSTAKLQNPQLSYATIMSRVVQDRYARLGRVQSHSARQALAATLSVVAPIGAGMRTVQIVGSFVILNGLIHALSSRF